MNFKIKTLKLKMEQSPWPFLYPQRQHITELAHRQLRRRTPKTRTRPAALPPTASYSGITRCRTLLNSWASFTEHRYPRLASTGAGGNYDSTINFFNTSSVVFGACLFLSIVSSNGYVAGRHKWYSVVSISHLHMHKI